MTAEAVFHPGDHWRSREAGYAVRAMAKLSQTGRVRGARDRDQVAELRWMVETIVAWMSPDDPGETVFDVLEAMRASGNQDGEINAGFLDALIDHYALLYSIDRPGPHRACTAGCTYPTGHPGRCSNVGDIDAAAGGW